MSTNQEQIETAARAIRGTREFRAAAAFGLPDDAHTSYTNALARAVIAAIHPTVSTMDQLDALPQWSAIIDQEGDVGQRLGEWWHFPETAPMRSSRVIKYGPATVLHMGGAA